MMIFRPVRHATIGLAVSALCLSSGPAAAQTPAPDTLELEAAVQRAQDRNPEIRRAEAQVERADAGEWESWGRLVPSLGLSLGLSESEVLQRTATDPVTGGIVELPDSLIQLQESYGTSAVLSADWTVFDGGERYWGIRRARAADRAAKRRVSAARARLAADVTIAYLDAVEAEFQEEVRAAEVERARKLHEIAETRFESGDAPQIDVLQARLAESDAEVALLEAEADVEATRLALFEYVDLSVESGVALTPPETVPADALPSDAALRSCVLGESAELAALRSEVQAAEQERARERWWFLPTVRLGATWVRSEFGRTQDALTFGPRNEQTFYRMQLSWTPFQEPGRWVADRKRAQASLATAEADLAARRPAIGREVEIALGRLRRARILDERAGISVELAEQQLEQASERYRLGVGDIVEQLQAESMARQAERQRISARFAALRAMAELERAAGTRLDGTGSPCS